MEEKKLTPKESMELIASMIQCTKRRVVSPDLRISVMWGLLVIATAAVAWFLLSSTHNPWFNLIWFAIPVIGIPVNIVLANGKREKGGTKTYVDAVSEAVWKCVGYIAVGLTVICFIAQQCGCPMAWLAMFYYAFIVVGFGATVSGLLLREKSYVFGGMFSIFSGFAVIVCNLCRVTLLYSWVVPLYILCFLLMFIVPAFIISRKIKASEK